MSITKKYLYIIVTLLSSLVMLLGPANAEIVLPSPVLDKGQRMMSQDDHFMAVTKAVPGFGGMFYDKNGDINVYLLDTTEKDAANTVLTSIFGVQRLWRENPEWSQTRFLPAGEIKVIQGQYSFAELKLWHDHIRTSIWGMGKHLGLVFIGIDEMSNRIKIAVEEKSQAVVSSIEAELATVGVPRKAVLIEVSDPIQTNSTLRNKVRPVGGGLQISFGSSICTLGFNIPIGTERGFVTNSHCSATMGLVTPTPYYQSVNPDYIGLELSDPPFFIGTRCYDGYVCRYSDSLIAHYDTGATSTLGRVYLPMTIGSLNIDKTGSIVAEVAYPFGGETLYKVGRTTGLTAGIVTDTCVDVLTSGTNIVMLCQDLVASSVQIVGGGDSGSNVFARTATTGTTGEIVHYGLLWGGNTTGTLFAFSALSNLRADLGNFATH